jgi:hypothetical protein
MKNEIQWLYGKNIDLNEIAEVENKLNIIFPEDYKKCIIQNDGGYPALDTFIVNGNEETFNNLLSISNVIEVYENIKDRLIDYIYPFAEDPFGNFLCFDYRESNLVKIVFWEHEIAFIDKNKAIYYVCNTFSELLISLYEFEE